MDKRRYYVLLERQDGEWSYEFGDYDSKVVREELIDRRDHFVKRKDLYILRVDGDSQAEIEAAVAEFRQAQEIA